MIMKIYVVTKGSYSDYHIVAATLDKEKAEAIAKRFSDKWDDCDVEEYEDCEVDTRPYWNVTFEGSTSNIIDCKLSDMGEYDIGLLNVFRKNIYRESYVTVAADTEKEAIKIAAEKRAEYLAKKEGVC